MSLNKQLLQFLIDRKECTSPAFVIDGVVWSYADFYCIVEQIYQLIYEKDEKYFFLYATDNIRTYASIVALWFAGKAYVPLNPNQPKERHVEVMSSVGTHFILSSDGKYCPGIDEVKVLFTGDITEKGYAAQNLISVSEISNSELAYILFTSGSTGKPKGVPITRGDLAAFIDSMNNIG